MQNLKETREAKGISLEDLFKQTRVRVTYLQAIENKEFNLLPVPVYSKNFIRIYARALGIDGEPIIEEYENYVNSQKKSMVTQEDVEQKKVLPAKSTGKKMYLIITLILMMLVIAIWLISKQHEPSSESMNSVKPNNTDINSRKKIDTSISLGQQAEDDSITVLEEKFRQSSVYHGNTVIRDEAIANNSYKNILAGVNDSGDKEGDLLVIRATEDTWLRIKADQKTPLKVFLKAGEKFEQKAAGFDIDIGNAAGVKIKFKGKSVENLGKTGEVVHLRLP